MHCLLLALNIKSGHRLFLAFFEQRDSRFEIRPDQLCRKPVTDLILGFFQAFEKKLFLLVLFAFIFLVAIMLIVVVDKIFYNFFF